LYRPLSRFAFTIADKLPLVPVIQRVDIAKMVLYKKNLIDFEIDNYVVRNTQFLKTNGSIFLLMVMVYPDSSFPVKDLRR
jgi:hypothetical protein